METTEKTMNPKVLEFIENAKKAQAEAQELERQKQAAERDALLISLGLCRMEMVEIKRDEAYKINFEGVKYDAEKDIYYRGGAVAIDVTDEEFEEIKKYAPKKEKIEQIGDVPLDNSAEQFLGVLNVISLVICCIAAFILIVAGMDSYRERYLIGVGIGLAVFSLIYYACMKVVLNISNNLHKINSKIK